MGVGGAAGRLVELGERQRGSQFEAAGALSASNPYCGLEGLLRGGRVRRGAAQKDLAANAVDLRIEGAMLCALDFGERSIERPSAASLSPSSASSSARYG